jgi:hypothetical protein
VQFGLSGIVWLEMPKPTTTKIYLTWRGELGSHRHEEAVEDVQGVLPCNLDLTAVEPAAKLDQLLRFFAVCPRRIHLICADVERRTSV